MKLGYRPIYFRDIPNIYEFPKILSPNSWGNSWFIVLDVKLYLLVATVTLTVFTNNLFKVIQKLIFELINQLLINHSILSSIRPLGP